MELTGTQFTVLVVYIVVSSAMFLGFIIAPRSRLQAILPEFWKEKCLFFRLIIFGLISCLLWPVVVGFAALGIVIYVAAIPLLFLLRLSAMQMELSVGMCCGFEPDWEELDLETGLPDDNNAAEPAAAAEDVEMENIETIEIAEYQAAPMPNTLLQMRVPEQPSPTDTEDESEGSEWSLVEDHEADSI